MEDDVKLARQGDREAFIRLIHELENGLYGVARSMVTRDEDCADAIQETILKAYHAIPGLKEPQYFKTWLFRILINECNSILKKRKRSIPSDTLGAGMAVAGASSDYDRVDLRTVVDRLEEGLRVVVTLHYFEDMPLRQISEVLGTPEGTVKSRLHRARLLLAEWLGPSTERMMSCES
ncbi:MULTISPECIES: sigma-70 family RNA polymerase sigma factor [unclassified Paenibacillus]|uniref:sigma-70 family RNA polymerase sigma factor n=1 Tax=unclassified Paenibacillus TaxID=185978 RepID=UPI0009300615|nr:MULTISPECIES: sigma-70 family RNA polymerase sigma factor [unclassified Paenibacillus]